MIVKIDAEDQTGLIIHGDLLNLFCFWLTSDCLLLEDEAVTSIINDFIEN